MITEKPPLRMPLSMCLRLIAIAYGMNEPPRGRRTKINLTRRPTNAGDFHWLAEEAARIARKLDEGAELDEETRRWFVEFFGRRHIPERDPDQEGLSLSERDAPTVAGPLDALIAAETMRDLLEILSPRERAVLQHVEAGLPVAEAAAAAAPSPGAARQLLTRLRKKIRRHL